MRFGQANPLLGRVKLLVSHRADLSRIGAPVAVGADTFRCVLYLESNAREAFLFRCLNLAGACEWWMAACDWLDSENHARDDQRIGNPFDAQG
jgi:hypothetical protein